MFKRYTVLVFLVLAFCLLSLSAYSQGQDKTVLFQGRVIASSNAEFLPLAYIFNPQAGRGALTDNFGQVDMYVFPGDSLVISYIGYKKKYYIVPRDTDLVHQVIIPMDEMTTMLREVKVFPHSSEEEFKQAFLAMELRDARQRDNARNNLEQSKLNVFALQAGMGASSNFRNFSDMMISSQANKSFFNSPMLALTNPFAWISFIKSVKNGDLKRKDYKKAYELMPKENLNRQMFLRNLKTN
ncbi:MAG: carboxypeptidase-like regulatory domain-containing protein [Cytophagales bacterium]|nr:carboxypeptidase-like regulatory domain-containing protein [Cytophagales bacterium]